MDRCCWSSTSRPPSARCRSRSPWTRASPWRISRAWRCAGSPTCHPGSAKTDARDARVIADAARTMPHTLRALKVDDETIAELTVLSGFDDDLAGQITATSNRIRGLLTQIHPAL